MLEREASYLPTHYEIRAPKMLQGGKEGVQLVSTHHAPGGVLGTVHGQPCLIPSEGPLSLAEAERAPPRKHLGRRHCPRGRRSAGQRRRCLTLPQNQCTAGKGDGGLAPPALEVPDTVGQEGATSFLGS